MKIYSNFMLEKSSKLILNNESLDGSFPTSPVNGEFSFVNGVLYIYSTIDGHTTWYPLTNSKLYYVHTQELASFEWAVEHNLNTENIIFFVYNELNELLLTEIAFNDIDPKNKLIIKLTEATKGRVVVFAAGDKFGVSGSGGGASSADMVSYSNEDYPTVASALDKLLYIAPTVSFSNNIGIVEVGTIINDVTLNWTVNKAIISQSISEIGNITPLDVRTKTITGLNIINNKSWTITVNDGKTSVSSTTSISFMWKRHWGVGSNSITSQEILSLNNSEFSNDNPKVFNVNATNGNFIWYCYPKAWGESEFSVGGFTGGFNDPLEITHTNINGGITTYYCYRSTNANLGNTTITVTQK